MSNRRERINTVMVNLSVLRREISALKEQKLEFKRELAVLMNEAKQGDETICWDCGEECSFNSAWGSLCPKHWGD